jgi:hypothetical protein
MAISTRVKPAWAARLRRGALRVMTKSFERDEKG